MKAAFTDTKIHCHLVPRKPYMWSAGTSDSSLFKEFRQWSVLTCCADAIEEKRPGKAARGKLLPLSWQYQPRYLVHHPGFSDEKQNENCSSSVLNTRSRPARFILFSKLEINLKHWRFNTVQVIENKSLVIVNTLTKRTYTELSIPCFEHTRGDYFEDVWDSRMV